MAVKVEPISFKGQDERGMTGEIDSLNRSGKFILAYRKAGSLSGNHYHKGFSAEKDPEVLFLFTGKVRLDHADVLEEQKLEIKRLTVNAPARVEIQRNTWHRLECLEDCCFLELNSFEQGDIDTFRVKSE